MSVLWPCRDNQETLKRAFNVVEAPGIDSDTEKRTPSLHTEGLGLQEIYHNIPGTFY